MPFSTYLDVIHCKLDDEFMNAPFAVEESFILVILINQYNVYEYKSFFRLRLTL
jgi:hypothetical protein